MRTTKLTSLSAISPPIIIKSKIDISTLDIEDIIEDFHNGTKSFGERKKFFEELTRRDPDLARENITNLCRNHEHAGSKDLADFICFMLDYIPLDIFEKLECTLALYNSNHSNARKYFLQILHDYTSMTKDTRPSIAIFIDILRYLLMEKIEPDSQTIKYIRWLFNDSSLLTTFIYKTIISIQRDEERKVDKSYLDCLYIEFFNSPIDDNHSILSAQYLLQHKLNIQQVESKLLLIAQSTTTAYNTRADSADLLIKLGSNTMRKNAAKIITELGKDMSKAPSLATNKQNVHAVDESVTKFLLSIGGIKLDVITKEGEAERVLSFDDIVERISSLSKYNESIDKINGSLLRIRIDQIIYPGSQSLSTIFIKIYRMVEKHIYKDMLLDRLIEELIDMSETCSSGHANRLVNVFSGVDNFIMNPGWKNQIESNISGRLNAKIRIAIDRDARSNLEKKGLIATSSMLEEIDQEYRAKIAMEMTSEEIEHRQSFNAFYKEYIISIHDELYNEFVKSKHISEEDFELYFRSGTIYYETGQRAD